MLLVGWGGWADVGVFADFRVVGGWRVGLIVCELMLVRACFEFDQFLS
jgi:hypothetical protein